MKIVTASNGSKTIKITKSEWKSIGKKAGWMKLAGGWGRFSEDLCDVLQAQVMIGKKQEKNREEILLIIKNNPSIMRMVDTEEMTDDEIREYIIEQLIMLEMSDYK